MAYDVTTRNFFRRHSASQVHKVEGTEVYFAEREAITRYVVEHFAVNRRMIKKAFTAIDHEWQRFQHKHPGRKLLECYDKSGLKAAARWFQQQSHVAFYVHGMTFSRGGIERLAAQLANHMVENGWQVTIYCRVHQRSTSIYPLYESVRVVPIFDEHKLDTSVKALNYALTHDHIDVFVPMLSEWLFEPIVEAAQNTGVTIIASEHNDPWKIEELWWNHEKRVACFEKVDAIHFLLNKYIESVPKHLHDKVITIPNGVEIPNQINLENREKLIVSVGRLVPQKRFDSLIEAVSLVQENLRGTGHRVEIYGEGELRNSLMQQIQQQNVEDIVFLMGNTSEIEKVYQRADFFVLASDFEGLPVTLLEALSYGLPVIGFKHCNGPNEIIRPEQEGLLVDSVQSLAEAIEIMINNNNDRIKPYNRAKDYSLANFYESWKEKLIDIVKV
ncbi:glycosyltransferase [Vreelandella nanhaiensis]|nr:glycosyltransferase [Halomonas nanhaiensis]